MCTVWKSIKEAVKITVHLECAYNVLVFCYVSEKVGGISDHKSAINVLGKIFFFHMGRPQLGIKF
jgi:hypothetical protein